MWDDVYRMLQVRRKIYIQSQCLKAIKRQRTAGLIEDNTVQTRLHAVGLDVPESARLREDWSCELRAVPKAEQAGQICKYLQQELITPAEAVRLIHRSGYTFKQSKRIVNSCLLLPRPKGLKTRADLLEQTNIAYQNAAGPESDPTVPPGIGPAPKR